MGNFTTIISYSPVCDIAVLAIIIGILLTVGDIVLYDKSSTMSLFRYAIVYLIIAVISRIAFEHIYNNIFDGIPKGIYYLLYDTTRICYYCQLSIYVSYMYSLMNIRGRRLVKILNSVGLIIAILATVLEPLTGLGMYIDRNYIIYKHTSGIGTFTFVHIFYIIMIVDILIYNRKHIMPRLFTILITVILLDLIILAMEVIKNTETFLSVTFIIPLIVMMFNVHSTPFDIVTGSYNYVTLTSKIESYKRLGIDFNIMCMTFIGLNDETMRDMQNNMFNFYDGYVQNAKLFKLNNNRFILTFKNKDNKNVDEAILSLMDILKLIANNNKADYKMLVIKDAKIIESPSELLDLIDHFEKKYDIDTMHYVKDKDIMKFREGMQIINEVQHIAPEKIFNNSIIKVYCQPIYNVKTNRFETAEALMRMEIPKIGMVFPDKFIKIAEDAGIIHKLSLIMLDKVCKEVKQIIEEGYDINRISVNFSIKELREHNFVTDIKNILDDNEIPYDKIGIELTESRTDKDFEVLQSKVIELKEMGMSIYLDDFGTGYSNMERIMKLPLDVIKFDRSLLLLNNENDRYKYLVSTMASLFHELDYTILFEGVETEGDEETCISMNATYLQGFKYSRPIPIYELRNFLDKKQPSVN